MNTDRNLLFGVLALQMDFIDSAQFVEACTLWTTRKDHSLGELLVEKGWVSRADTVDIERLLERKLKKHGGDARAGLAAVDDDVKRSLAAVGDAEIQRSLADLAPAMPVAPMLTVSLETIPEAHERYKLERLHATGGIGRVWLARDSNLFRDVALKELRPERADNSTLWTRFLQEARITGQLEHPGIVPVYELGKRSDNEQPFYTMRFLKGRTLSEAARAYHEARQAGRNEPLELLALLNAFVAVCNTIAYAHSRGVIHRDLKGQNVIVGSFGEVVVVDWGLAKLLSQAGAPDSETMAVPLPSASGSGAVELTAHGQAMGTPAYMAPEQAAGRSDLVGLHTDIYGLGAILYEILSGQPPFTGSDTLEVLRKVKQEDPLPLSYHWAEVPEALSDVCLRALAKDPAARHASANELGHAVQLWQEVQRRKAEDALRESEAFYHSLVENLPQSILRKDCEGRFTFGNQRFCTLLGRPLDQIVGRTDFDFFPPELAEKYRDDDRQVMAGRRLLEAVEKHVTPAGETLYVHVIKTPIFDVQDKVIGTQGIFWDVTEKRRAEVALAYERYLLQALMDNLPDNVYFKDTASRFVRINPALARYFGLKDPDQAVGKTDFDFFTPTHAEPAYRDEQEVMRSGQPIIGKEEKEIWRDGGERWVSTTKMPLRNEDGVIVGTFGISHDMTKRKRAEERLAEEGNLLRTLIDHLPDYIYTKDTHGRYRVSNVAHQRLLGVRSAAEVVGKTAVDFFPQALADRIAADEKSVLESGQPLLDREDVITDPNGHERRVSISKIPLRDSGGKIIGLVCVSRDVVAPRHFAGLR